jgi:hypothetical protein
MLAARNLSGYILLYVEVAVLFFLKPQGLSFLQA